MHNPWHTYPVVLSDCICNPDTNTVCLAHADPDATSHTCPDCDTNCDCICHPYPDANTYAPV